MTFKPYKFFRRYVLGSIGHFFQYAMSSASNHKLKFSQFVEIFSPSKSSGFDEELNWVENNSVLRSYLLDWVITFLLWSAAFICDKIDGFRRQFDIHDSSIAHTFTEHERVPVGQLALLSVFLPAISMVILNRLQHHSIRDIHHGLLGLLLGLSLTTVVTQVTKICIGRPRPDLLDRCKPQLPLPMGTIWTNSSICSTHTKSYRLIDGFRSFPSGHSSTAWAGLGFLSLYTSAKLKTFEKPERRVVNPIFSLLPLILASWISISRTMDYRHHWEDVVIGGLLGMLMAWFSYRMYYPSITSQDSHEPFHFRYHHPMLSDYEPVESNIEDEDIP